MPPRWGRRGVPPPWWPEGQPWPPREGQIPRLRRRFFIAFALLFGGLIALIFVAGWTASRVFDRPWHSGGEEWDGPPLFGYLLLAAGIVLIMRFIRRFAAPIADIMEVAERVAVGDYAARVEPRGPRVVRRLAGTFNEMIARIESNDVQRRRLLADVTHELRTPLSVIRGNVEGMLDGVYPRDDEHLGPIVEETKQMARLLDDLHTLATAEAGALQLHREAVDLRELVEDVVRAYAPGAADRRVEVTTRVADVPEIELDPVRIRQVLGNALANALRYTPAGGEVRIDVTRSNDEVTFNVIDTGPGAPPETVATMFDRFAKAADSGGSGLGLAIAKSLVEAHGGRITAESRPGAGMTIRFTIPIPRA
ncbi:MAG: HAMP domain-containing histidine kinase [Thermomicrobiales bacterium]|nr:HAMP domain-containing histidine kinase [Thermomicrobiales bacterium]